MKKKKLFFKSKTDQTKIEFDNFQNQLKNMKEGLSRLKSLNHQVCFFLLLGIDLNVFSFLFKLTFNASELPIDASFIGIIEASGMKLPEPLNNVQRRPSDQIFRRDVDLYLKRSLLCEEIIEKPALVSSSLNNKNNSARHEKLKKSSLFGILTKVNNNNKINENKNTISSRFFRINQSKDKYVVDKSIDDENLNCRSECFFD